MSSPLSSLGDPVLRRPTIPLLILGSLLAAALVGCGGISEEDAIERQLLTDVMTSDGPYVYDLDSGHQQWWIFFSNGSCLWSIVPPASLLGQATAKDDELYLIDTGTFAVSDSAGKDSTFVVSCHFDTRQTVWEVNTWLNSSLPIDQEQTLHVKRESGSLVINGILHTAR